MAIFRDKEIQCEKCKTIYESKVPSFIRVPADNNLKGEILSGEIHCSNCPECGYKNFEPAPLLYVDDEKEIAIIADTYEEALMVRKQLQEEYPNFKYYFAENPWIITDIINAIDNGFDPLVLEFIKYDGKRFFEKKAKKYQVRNSYISYSDDGYDLKLVFVVSDINGDFDEKEMTISSELFNNYVEKVEKFKVGADLSVISEHYIKKLYYLARNLKVDEAKQTSYEFLLYRDEYDNAHMAFVQSFNNGKFKKGEKVALVSYDKKNNCSIKFCTIESIIHMYDYEYYSEINDLPVATYKVDDFELESSLPSDTQLHNEELKEALLNNFKKNDYELIFNSKVILPKTLALRIVDFSEAQISFEEIFSSFDLNDKKYFPLYLDQSDVIDDSVGEELVVDIKTALKAFFSMADKYDGIIFNPDTDKITISVNELFEFFTNRIMTNHDLMVDFLNNASKEEIDFIGEEKYNLIKKVYSTDIGLKAIREELNLSKEKADYMLSDGYGRIKRIIKSRELM